MPSRKNRSAEDREQTIENQTTNNSPFHFISFIIPECWRAGYSLMSIVTISHGFTGRVNVPPASTASLSGSYSSKLVR